MVFLPSNGLDESQWREFTLSDHLVHLSKVLTRNNVKILKNQRRTASTVSLLAHNNLRINEVHLMKFTIEHEERLEGYKRRENRFRIQSLLASTLRRFQKKLST